MSAEDVERQIVEDGFLGLKPYRLYTTTGDPKESRITDFLPEHQLEVADRYGLGIILQLSKSGGVADDDNINDLERLSERYAHVRFIMAHCARAFYPQPLDRVGERLARLRNVYFDSAAVCEYGSYDRLLELVGPAASCTAATICPPARIAASMSAGARPGCMATRTPSSVPICRIATRA